MYITASPIQKYYFLLVGKFFRRLAPKKKFYAGDSRTSAKQTCMLGCWEGHTVHCEDSLQRRSKMHNAPSPGLPNVFPNSEDRTAARRIIKRQPVDSSAAVLPFRPPKSPSSLNTPHVHPKSPPLPRNSRSLSRALPSEKHKREADPSNALSPTSVVDSRGYSFLQRQSSQKTERQRPNESDASLVEAGNACVKVRLIPMLRLRWIPRIVIGTFKSHFLSLSNRSE